MMAVALFYFSHFSNFTLEHRQQSPTATTWGCSPPAPLCPEASVLVGHPAPLTAQWATLHHLLHPSFPNHAVLAAEEIHSPTLAATLGQAQPKVSGSSPNPTRTWGWRSAGEQVHNLAKFPTQFPQAIVAEHTTVGRLESINPSQLSQ